MGIARKKHFAGSYLSHGPSDQTVGPSPVFTIETDHPGIVLVMDGLDDPHNQYGPFSQ